MARGREVDVDRAVEVAWSAFDSTWSGYSAGRRQRVLNAIADTLEHYRQTLR